MFALSANSLKMKDASQRLLAIQDIYGMEINAHLFHVHQAHHTIDLVNAVKSQNIIVPLVLSGTDCNVYLSLAYALMA